jgi:hypothetical protein
MSTATSATSAIATVATTAAAIATAATAAAAAENDGSAATAAALHAAASINEAIDASLDLKLPPPNPEHLVPDLTTLDITSLTEEKAGQIAQATFLKREQDRIELQAKNNKQIKDSEDACAQFKNKYCNKERKDKMVRLAKTEELSIDISLSLIAISNYVRTSVEIEFENGFVNEDDEEEAAEPIEMPIHIPGVSLQSLLDLKRFCELRAEYMDACTLSDAAPKMPVIEVPVRTSDMIKNVPGVFGQFAEDLKRPVGASNAIGLSKPDPSRLYCLVSLANFLDMPFLIHLCCATIASLVKDADAKDIPQILGATE